MTETMIDLPGVIAKSDDADFLRELIQDAAQRLMELLVVLLGRGGRTLTRTFLREPEGVDFARERISPGSVVSRARLPIGICSIPTLTCAGSTIPTPTSAAIFSTSAKVMLSAALRTGR